MALNIVLGPTAKVDMVVGATVIPLRVLSGRLQDNADVSESSDSETLATVAPSSAPNSQPQGSKEFHPSGMISVSIELEMQLDLDVVTVPTVQMFQSSSGLSLQPGNRVALNIWPEGRVGRNSNWQFNQAIVQAVSGAFMVRGSQPQAASVSLRSTGLYKRPYESATIISTSPAANVIVR